MFLSLYYKHFLYIFTYFLHIGFPFLHYFNGCNKYTPCHLLSRLQLPFAVFTTSANAVSAGFALPVFRLTTRFAVGLSQLLFPVFCLCPLSREVSRSRAAETENRAYRQLCFFGCHNGGQDRLIKLPLMLLQLLKNRLSSAC